MIAAGYYTDYITVTAIGVTGSPKTIPISLTVVKGRLDGTQKWAFATGVRVYSSPAIGADGTNLRNE